MQFFSYLSLCSGSFYDFDGFDYGFSSGYLCDCDCAADHYGSGSVAYGDCSGYAIFFSRPFSASAGTANSSMSLTSN